ncbi:hypothetical protein Rhe02_93240 [Rhizocola hellebori]|uniref:Uncharacterized protein n=1 Tax=Rhizocola hellebori TaxID=1392758 RepID=A0A8J3QKF8_9ACTN|nr:hypothetical protein [Rhizocola hellebori]GIH11257.1 hypothetical protein Rhe02_93240 [Rhizocola hellebori]
MRMLTVVCVVLGSVPLLAAPSTAAPGCPPVSFTASADARLLNFALVDLRPLGLETHVANLTLAPTKAGMATTATVRGSAQAEYLDGSVLGLKLPRGPLEARVAQQAPPANQNPARNTALAVDLGPVGKIGAGSLEAQAQWTDPMTCGTQTGLAGQGAAAIVDAAILPGSSGAMVRASQNLQSRAATALVPKDGRAASAARAEIGLSKLELLGNAITVRVVQPPSLNAIATGRKETSSVEYHSPLLEITAPGLGTKKLDTPGQSLEIPIPTTTLSTILSGLPLRGLTLGQHPTLIRLTLGTFTQTITDREVTASATSLRVELLTPGTTHLLDLNIGLLTTSATAPPWAAAPTSPPPPGCGTPACQLPLTGFNIGLATGAGILVLILGRFLLLLTTRRPRT